VNGSGNGIREAAAAKVNLFLHVMGRRPDGFHEIDSLVTFAALGDTVFAQPADRLSLSRAGPMAAGLPPVGDDLALRAAALLAELAGVAPAAALELEKNLPVASGLGGGTADAAAAIRALARLWRVALTADRRAALAAQLGADLTVCLHNRPARVGGIGERLASPGSLPRLHAVLANPGVALATGDVFAAYAAALRQPDRAACPIAAWAPDTAAFVRQLAAQRNDLTDAAISVCPAIDMVLTRLAAQPNCRLARMSGSGASCFGLFADAAAAQSAAAALRQAQPRWWVAATELLGSA